MKRRDFLKTTLAAGAAATAAAAVPGAFFTLEGCSGGGSKINGKADTLVLGNIITIDGGVPFAEAMTIKNGLVQFVGSKAAAQKYCDANTKVVDYGTNSVYPGFMEAHCHGAGAGEVEKAIKLFDAMSYREYRDIIADYIAKHPDMSEYRIAGWRVLLDGPVTKELLDSICSDKPVFGGSMDGHNFLLNTKAMAKFGIDKSFCEKYGPVMAPADADGNPNGFFCETACADIMKLIKRTPEAVRDNLLLWQKFAFEHGYVAAAEAGVNMIEGSHEVYKKLAESGEMKLRTRAFWNVVQDEASEQTVTRVDQIKKECTNEYYKIVGLKIFIDGVVESHTGLLVEPYTDDPSTTGLNRYPDKDKLNNLVLAAHRHGLPTHTHTIGDGAVRYMLDAIQYAKDATGDMSIRDMLAHIELVKDSDIKRFAKYNVSAIVAPLWAPKNAITPFEQEVQYLGDERASVNYQAINSFVGLGINAAQHTDYPVSREVNVPRSIYCAVTRCLPEGGDKTLRDAKEAVSRLEALRELTINVAYLWNEENHLGSLTPGKAANWVVYNCDFIDDDINTIPDAKLLNVVVDGEEVYKA